MLDKNNMHRARETSLGEMPRISIVTVVRNDASGLARTIANVAAQDYPAVEYIVVDGASTDGTRDVIKSNAATITRWISEPDAGLYDGMNKGRSLATGDYALFLNAGDIFASEGALKQIILRRPSPNVILYGNVLIEYSTRRWRVPALTAEGAPSKRYLPHHQSILYPREFYQMERYDLFFRVMGDVDYTCRALHQFPREYRPVDLVQSTLGGFTFRMSGTWKGTLQMLRERRELYRRYFPSQSAMGRILSYVGLCAKGLLIALLGVRGATLAMEWKHRFTAVRARGETGMSKY